MRWADLVSCVGEIALDDLMVIAGQLRWPEFEGELVQLSGKTERNLIILVVYGRTSVDADVKGFVDGHEERNGVRDFSGSNVLIVHPQDAGAAFTEARPVVFEVEHDGVLARRKGLLAFPTKPLQIKEVIEKHWLAFEQVQAVTTKAST